MQNDLAEQLVYGSKSLVTAPYRAGVTAASTIDLTAIGSAADHPAVEVRTFQNVAVHARLSESPGSLQFSVVRYTKDADGVLQLQSAEAVGTLSSLVFTNGGSLHMSAPITYDVRGADVIKVVTTVVSAATADIWVRAY